MRPFFLLLLAVAIAAPVAGQRGLGAVDSLASAGRADEARAALESWWENSWPRSNRRDRQRGLWLRGVLTVDPDMAGLDFRRLVVEYPGGSYSDEALMRLAWIALAEDDLPGAAGHFRTLVRDYPRSPGGDHAASWLVEHETAVAEAEARRAQVAEAEARQTREAEGGDEPVPARTEEVEAEDVGEDVAAATASGRFAVQLGAFSSEERARALLARITRRGFEGRIVHVPGSLLVRVRIGRFKGRQGASELLTRVVEMGYDATVVSDATDEEPIT